MQVKKIAVLAAALLLCSCGEADNSDVLSEAALTSAETSATEIIDETTAREILTEEYPVSEESISESEVTTETSSEISAETSSEISEETSETTSPPETQTTAESSETAAYDIRSETVTFSSAKTSSAEEKPIKVTVPKIATGNFTGAKTLENDIASVDISDAASGVVQVSYKGSCSNVKVRITMGDNVYDYGLSGSAVYPLQSGSGEYNVKVLENISGKTYAIALDESFSAEVSDFSPYLLPSQYISFSQSDNCVKKAAELCAGCDSDAEKIAAIFKYVTDNISYDKQLAASVKSGYIPDPDSTLAKGTGICFDYASLLRRCAARSPYPQSWSWATFREICTTHGTRSIQRKQAGSRWTCSSRKTSGICLTPHSTPAPTTRAMQLNICPTRTAIPLFTITDMRKGE